MFTINDFTFKDSKALANAVIKVLVEFITSIVELVCINNYNCCSTTTVSTVSIVYKYSGVWYMCVYIYTNSYNC